MRVFLMISLFYVQYLSENNHNILHRVSEVTDDSTVNPNSFRLVQENVSRTISQSVTYVNKTLKHPSPLLCRYYVTDAEIPHGNNPNNGFRPDENELNATAVSDRGGLNGTVNNERSVTNNETFDDERSVYNVTFDEKARVDGYVVTKAEQSPYSVLLVTKGSKQSTSLCTGSLLTAEWVLTAGHCVTVEEGTILSIEIYAGGNSYDDLKIGSQIPETAQLLTSSEFHAHPKYNYGQEKHDVGLVKARDKFNMTDTVKTITLFTGPWTYVGYRTCTIVGFGIVSYKKRSVDDYKRKTHTLSVKNPCKCNFQLKRMFGMLYPTKTFICAKPVQDYGICNGDSGGGLVCDGQIRATAMMIVKMYDTKMCEEDAFSKVECASDRALTVFLETCPYLRWINSYAQVLKEENISDKCVEFNREPRVNQASVVCVTAAVATSVLLVVCS